MRRRLLSTLLALCMMLALVPGTAGAAESDKSYSYETTITTSKVTVGYDNYSCDVSLATGEITPHISNVVDGYLKKFAVLHDGDVITVYPNKYGTTSNGKYTYVDASVGSGYVYEKYIIFKEGNSETPKPEEPVKLAYLTAQFSDDSTSATILEGDTISVQWNKIIDPTQ